jgi:aldehyde dehydrogenase (NAD+)
MGKGSIVGEAITTSPLVQGVSFTGSTAVGMKVLQQAVERGAKIQLEMGGKNPLVVVDDADIDVAVNCAVQGAFFSTGQRCTASSRLVVTDKIHDQFIDTLISRMAALRIGAATDSSTEIGPVADSKQLEKDIQYIERAKSEGGDLIQGGRQLARATPGYYLEPALFVNTTPSMTINRDEIFGPVASVIRVRDYDEALMVANDTPYGLCGGIVTRSLKYATHYRRNAAVGMVMVNLPTAGVDYHVPFGGRKNSSYGPREQGMYAVEFYTTVKTSYLST